MTSENATSIRSRWTLEEYRDLVAHIYRAGLRIVGTEEFGERSSGVWLRHDVELSLNAALAMAQLEHAMDVPSSYFVCVESPFLDSAGLDSVIHKLVELGRDVSFHLVLSPSVSAIEERLSRLNVRFPSVAPRALTFHAPGVPTEVLAAAPLGNVAYGPLAAGTCKYYSDSTGSWRWGDPRYAHLTEDDVVQVLTHPFWWSGTYNAAELALGDASTFLPQFSHQAGVVASRQSLGQH